MNDYKRLFEQISPKESDEMLIGRLRARKAENMKENKTPKHILLRKAVVIPAAAVLAVGAVTLSVGAAVNWDYAKAFKGMFARQYEGNVPVNSTVQQIPVESSAPENTPAETKRVEYTPEKPIGTFDFEKYGKQLGIVLEGDGITATLDGMLVYDDLCYIMYTTTATDELLAKTGGVVPGLRIDFGSFGFKIDGKIAGGMDYKSETISEEGNTKIGCIEISYNSVDLAGKTLNIGFLSEITPGDPSTAVINQQVDIPIDFNLAENIEKELDIKLKTDNFDGEFYKVKVSGLRTMLFFSGMETGGYECYDINDAVITLKDGTTVVAKCSGVAGGTVSDDNSVNYKGEIELLYTYPLDPADVASIAFGDYTIDF